MSPLLRQRLQSRLSGWVARRHGLGCSDSIDLPAGAVKRAGRAPTAMFFVSLPPELADRIIDHLHDDRKALGSCSLVCRAWRPCSQFHLFERVHVDSFRFNSDWIAAEAAFRADMRHTPALLSRARALTLEGPSYAHRPFASLAPLRSGMPNLRSLTTRTSRHKKAGLGEADHAQRLLTPPVDGSAEHPVQSVRFEFCCHDPGLVPVADPNAAAWMELAVCRTAPDGRASEVDLAETLPADAWRGGLATPTRLEVWRLPHARKTGRAYRMSATWARECALVRAIRRGDSLLLCLNSMSGELGFSLYSLEVDIVTEV